jgi:uncharacterized protein (TIGR02246 family)
MNSSDESKIRELYQLLLDSWNNNRASDFAQLFTGEGSTIGFDGSQMLGREQIEKELDQIFTSHKVASYVSIIREIRQLSSSVYLLRAVAGMIPPGRSEIKPDVNAIQVLVAQKENDQFRIASFQNTPAAFHRHPELSEQLTRELQNAYNEQQGRGRMVS